MSRIPSDLTLSDFFCGAGGNTIGAKMAGMRVRVGANHWDKAIEVYGQNNPDVDCVMRCDLSSVDPRRFPRTDGGIFSPECTTHSPSGGNFHRKEPDLFDPESQGPLDPATARSRVTMFDVIRFTEYHRYRFVIVENVVEVTTWPLFVSWLEMMHRLGYLHRIVSRNSLFHHPTPQSRDRVYIVFWQKGNRAPQVDYTPFAPCARCGQVRAVQAWKPGRTIGKYRRQYNYRCPSCAALVTPYFYAALNALDLSIAAERIGDRRRALKPRTRERIRFGLDKFGHRALVVNVKQGERDSSRAWPADVRELGTVPTWDGYFGFAHPSAFLVNGYGTTGAGGLTPDKRVRGLDEPHFTQAASCAHDALIQAPGFLVDVTRSNADTRPRALGEPMPTQVAQQSSALVTMAPFMVTAGSRSSQASALDAMPTQTGSERLAVVQGAQISLRDAEAMRCADVTRELMTQGAAPQQGVLSRAPFLVSYYGTDQATDTAAAMPTVTVIDRHASVTPALDVDDCFFRMLEPHEIGAAMAFPAAYKVTGTKRDRVKMYGNAVTPPVMDWLVRQCAATLAPELGAEDVA